jgi:hypothetical protein
MAQTGLAVAAASWAVPNGVAVIVGSAVIVVALRLRRTR